ncbi:MAG: transporter [Thiovulaceae bacterium]|nr:transporter [Sulfurimonadaceae bacterium]
MKMSSKDPKNKVLQLSMAALFLGTTQLFAGPPFMTDDPVPVDYKHSEFYIFSTYDKTNDGQETAIPAFEYNYGVLPDVQLHVMMPFISSQPNGSKTEYGLSDIELGAKYRFIQETENIPQVGIFPMAEIPTGDSNKGLGNGKTWWRLPVWMQKSFGEWTSYWGGGYVINEADGQKNYIFGGVQVQKDVGTKWSLGGEIFAREKDTVDGMSATILNFGGFYKFTPDFNLLFSAGRSINGESHTVGYIGLWWTFGGDEQDTKQTASAPSWSMTQAAKEIK